MPTQRMLPQDPVTDCQRDPERLGWYGRLAGCSLVIRPSRPAELPRLVGLLRRFFAVEPATASDADRGADRGAERGALRLRMADEPPPLPGGQHATEVPTGSELRVWQTASGLHFSLGDAVVAVDDRAGEASGRLGPDFWQRPPLAQRGLLLVVLLALLPARRRYGLHASALATPHLGDDVPAGLLVVGDSGAGKSTLTLCLVRSGWRFVADDAIVLARSGSAANDGATAWGVRRSLSCGLPTARRYPELARQLASGVLQSDGKLLLDLDEIYPGQSASACAPAVLLFPEIGRSEVTTLEPLDQTTAFHRLLGQMSIATEDRERAADQLATVRRLVTQAERCRMVLGADVLEQPDRVAAAVRDTVAAFSHGVAPYPTAERLP
ncbi:MAG: hypothetical protein IT306_00940 [Chloroflexi bacterium]|nr:hypothetical protein [Chloroflexota bacterium]